MKIAVIFGLLFIALQVSAQCYITLAESKAMIQAAFNFARANDSADAFTIVVVDSHSNIKALARMDGAKVGSVDTALKKARFASQFGISSGDFAALKLNLPGKLLYRIELTTGVVSSVSGGIVLAANGSICGAIGVSGSYSAQLDTEVASAGAAVFGSSLNGPINFAGQNTVDLGITLVEANQRIEASLAEAEKLKTLQGITILDRYNYLKMMFVMDGAAACAFDLAPRKAISASLFGVQSASIEALLQPDSPYFTVDNIPGITGLPGAWPINNAQGEQIGAIGASGDPNPAVDVQVSGAGAYPTQVTLSQIPTLTLPQALGAISIALTSADAAGTWAAAAVIDLEGRLVASYRMDGVPPMANDIVQRKALGSLAFSLPTSQFLTFSRPTDPAYSIEWIEGGLVLYSGGFPIFDPVSGKISGAVGVYVSSMSVDLENAIASWAANNVSKGYTENSVKVPEFNPKNGRITYFGDNAPLAEMNDVVEDVMKDATNPIAIAGYDAGGALKLFVRQDNVPGIAPLIARKVAEFSYLNPIPSSDFQQYLDPTNGAFYTLQNSNGGLVAAAGGAPAIHQGRLYASFGVSSGIQFPQNDQQTAQELADAFVNNL